MSRGLGVGIRRCQVAWRSGRELQFIPSSCSASRACASGGNVQSALSHARFHFFMGLPEASWCSSDRCTPP
eukprot:6573029-Pyramimonas_sp.AAC.1